MASPQTATYNPGAFSTVRLDMPTKIGMMAAVILSCGPDGMTPDDAIKIALELHEKANAAIKRLKNGQ